MVVIGLRVNEALGLDEEEEVDLKEAVLTIRRAKNRKSRFVPLSLSTAERMGAYRAERNRILGHGQARRSSFSRMATDRPTAAPATTFPWSANESVFASGSRSVNTAAARAYMICATPSRCGRSWTGIGAASIRIARCSSSARIWGTRGPRTLTGTSEAIPELLKLACERAERNLAGRESR
ncbi:MAG: tyrosine-type recombinase/integrase [Candidatus Binataceae bacterium]